MANPIPNAHPAQQLPAFQEMSRDENDDLIRYCRQKDYEKSDSFKNILTIATVIVAIAIVLISSNVFLAAIASPIFYSGVNGIYNQFRNRDYQIIAYRLATPDFRQFMARNRILPRPDFVVAAFDRYERHLKDVNARILEAQVV